MIEQQEGRCGICGGLPDGKWERLAVDHDHATNQVRGLLCTNCNLILGNAQDNTEILERAINYLEFHNGKIDSKTA